MRIEPYSLRAQASLGDPSRARFRSVGITKVDRLADAVVEGVAALHAGRGEKGKRRYMSRTLRAAVLAVATGIVVAMPATSASRTR
jgi:hypothetical protein